MPWLTLCPPLCFLDALPYLQETSLVLSLCMSSLTKPAHKTFLFPEFFLPEIIVLRPTRGPILVYLAIEKVGKGKHIC